MREGRVAFDLNQVEVAGRIDHLLEQAPRGCLRVPEDGAVGLHVLRVAADVGDQEHARRVSSTRETLQVCTCPTGRYKGRTMTRW